MPNYNNTTPAVAALRRGHHPTPDDPPPADVLARTFARSHDTHDEYVVRYTARQRGHVLLTATGLALGVVAALHLAGLAQHLLIALGAILTITGGVSYFVMSSAHRTYTQYLAVSVSETYERPTPPSPQPVTIRPFVASANGDGRTTNTGRLDFPPTVWRDLFDRALAKGGAVTRDDARAAGVGRRWYYGETAWKGFLEELTRLGFVDGRNRITPAAREWYAAQIPLPLAAIPSRPRPSVRPSAPSAGERDNEEGWGES